MRKIILYLSAIITMLILASCTIEKSDLNISTSTIGNKIYIVKEYDGKVAIFQKGVEHPIQTLECLIKDLPPDAVEALATGIVVYDIDELQKIIEAYD